MFTFSSAVCQRSDWPAHRTICSVVKENRRDGDEDCSLKQSHAIAYFGKHGNELKEKVELNVEEADILATVKFGGRKSKLLLSKHWNGCVIFKMLAQETRVPLSEMKVIIRGKLVTAGEVSHLLTPKTLMLVLGTPMKSAEGLHTEDIDCLMRQMGTTRNQAIDALRRCASLIDAMVDVGN